MAHGRLPRWCGARGLLPVDRLRGDPARALLLCRRGRQHDGHDAAGRVLHGSWPRCAPGAVRHRAGRRAGDRFSGAPLSGGSINPARQFGPAAFARQTTELRIYLVAPIQGAALGAWLHHLLSRRQLTREVRLRASGEPPDGPLAAPRPRQAPRRSRSDGPTPPPQPPSGQCEWAVACRTW
ncbi:aquaporin [Streptomyces mirabilis]|uniref:aquaporin n=1 Tax=Streptomyces mirabilis TaxID=68239 RepID=UPI00369E3AF0